MSFKENQYIELYNPATEKYFPVRILSVNENGLRVLSIKTNKEIDVQNYFLNTHGYRIPSISEKLLLELGFKKDNLIYINNDKTIIESLVGEITMVNQFPFYFDFSSNLLGYKFFDTSEVQKIQDFKELLKNTSPSVKNSEFKENHNTSFRIEDLINFYKLDFSITDDAISKAY